MSRTADLSADIGEVLLTEEAIATRVAELGRRIAADYAGRSLTLVSVLKGSLPFMADLMRQIDLPLRIDLMEVSSYGGTATESSGLVRIIKDLSASISGEDVLLVEDIIDTGLTLNYLVRYLRGKNPAIAPDLHAPRQARATPGGDPGRLPGLRDPGPVRGRATGSTTASGTETCASWACSAPRSTAPPSDAAPSARTPVAGSRSWPRSS